MCYGHSLPLQETGGSQKLKRITRVALALFVGALIVYEPDTITVLVDTALKAFGKEAAKIEAKKK